MPPPHDLGLARALVLHLDAGAEAVRFTLRPEAEIATVWVAGFRPGEGARVRAARREHPGAFLLVTGRGPVERFEPCARAAGADAVLAWPVAWPRLAELLARGTAGRGAAPRADAPSAGRA